ncbi:MAG: hypothetical protein EZS28_013343 [Streblomastix strix]|uniref:Uncharacterized protein n=1 Tax=Streblomastix strix TaxID=222440 RepID=A0A5J4W9S9_9EUKA|nr:MAG: hypothetical protein EZS28_013343 [Streblomastix strix]
MKQNPSRIASATPEQQLEKHKDYVRRIAQVFRQECINIITKNSVPTMTMRFTIPAMIHNVQFERKIEISQDDGDAELKGTAISDIGGLQQQLNVIKDELNKQTHFRGYYLLNTDIQQLENSAYGDFAFSAESGTVWMYDNSWYNSGDIDPDQVTPASDATLLVDNGIGVAGTSNEYSRGDHQHPLQVSDETPKRDTGTGAIGTSTTYFRDDHQHILNTDRTVANKSQKDTGTGANGNFNYYARSNHAHALNVDPTITNVPLQLTYVGNVIATKFIKSGGTSSQVLCANGDTKAITDFNTNVTPKLKWNLRIQNGYDRRFESTQLGKIQTDIMICADILETSLILRFYMKVFKEQIIYFGILIYHNSLVLILRISGSAAGCGLTINLSNESGIANRELHISADGNTLSFNGSVNAGTGVTNGSVLYSAGNPILWGGNSTVTEGRFYSDGAKVYWRAKPVTLGSVPPQE